MQVIMSRDRRVANIHNSRTSNTSLGKNTQVRASHPVMIISSSYPNFFSMLLAIPERRNYRRTICFGFINMFRHRHCIDTRAVIWVWCRDISSDQSCLLTLHGAFRAHAHLDSLAVFPSAHVAFSCRPTELSCHRKKAK